MIILCVQNCSTEVIILKMNVQVNFYVPWVNSSGRGFRWGQCKSKIHRSRSFFCFSDAGDQYSRFLKMTQVAYCRATQELSNGGWSMIIHRGTKTCHFLCEIFWAPANSMNKIIHHGAYGRLRVMGLERVEIQRVILNSGLCLES